MYRVAIELSRLAFVFLVRGVLLILLPALAIRLPEQTLVMSMIAAGGVVGSFGVFEVAAGSISRALPSTKLFFVGHGVISIAFGALTATIPVVTPVAAARMAMIFAVVYGLFAIVLAARLQFVPRAREAVAGWGLFNLACAALLASGTLASTNALLYAGALYSALLGLFQLFAAIWIRRGQELAERNENHHAPVVYR